MGQRRFVSGALLAGAALLSVPITSAEEPSPYRILVTNDDGIGAPGLAALAESLRPLGEVIVIAPAENQSGIGHALTLRGPITLRRRQVGGQEATAVAATPASVVRVALGHLLADTPPNLVVSGVNRGLNWGRNAYISGTVGAAREAALMGLPAIASSLAIEGHPEYTHAAALTARVAAAVKQAGMDAGTFLNVNIPAGEPRGVRVARQSMLAGVEQFEERRSPYGMRYLWNMFRQPTEAQEAGTDVAEVLAGYAAVTPLRAYEGDPSSLDELRSGLGELLNAPERQQ